MSQDPRARRREKRRHRRRLAAWEKRKRRRKIRTFLDGLIDNPEEFARLLFKELPPTIPLPKPRNFKIVPPRSIDHVSRAFTEFLLRDDDQAWVFTHEEIEKASRKAFDAETKALEETDGIDTRDVPLDPPDR